MSVEAWVTFWVAFAGLTVSIIVAVVAVVWRQGTFEGTTTEKVDALGKEIGEEKQSRFKRDSDLVRTIRSHDERIKKVEQHVAVHEDRDDRERTLKIPPKTG